MYDLISEDYLMHHGVKGMKWGVRRERNKNYSLDQQRRDSRVYGRTGVGRINRRMNKGYSISAARSMESDRINSFRRSARVSGQIGSTIGGIIGSLSGYAIGRNGIKIGRRQYSFKANSIEEQMIVNSAISIGTGIVGKQLGRYGGQSIAMLAGGYSPKKFR